MGFNHNIKYRGQIYHVQTEDSGADSPRVTTHVFLGGNIVASKRTSYADVVGADNLAEVVRSLMEEQHKEMLRNLVNGVYDARGPAAARPGALPASVPAQPASAPPAARAHAPAPPATVPAPAAPAAAGGAAPPPREPAFGEGIVTARSLDEVILAYLAGEREDREP